MKKIFLLLALVGTIASSTAQNITSGEYFFDTAPALGGGTPFNLTAGSTVTQTLTMPISSLSSGFHNLFIRVKDANGVWSHYEGRVFYIIPTPANTVQPQLVSGEWFIDTDPGLGNATAISFTQGNTINTTLNIPTPTLSVGTHNLFIRVKDVNGVWSHYEGRVFSISALGTVENTIKPIKVYPNPTKSFLTLQTPNNVSLDKVTITDLTGKIVLEQTQNSTQVNVAQLSSGMYILQAFSGTEKMVSKFVKE